MSKRANLTEKSSQLFLFGAHGVYESFSPPIFAPEVIVIKRLSLLSRTPWQNNKNG
jgi:hypothetical protein